MSQFSEGDYKGKPTCIISFSSEDKFPFQFGLKKAKLILSHLVDIKKFVEKHDHP